MSFLYILTFVLIEDIVYYTDNFFFIEINDKNNQNKC